jgi:UDP-N-acetylglucosamine 2-epimerase (non-hydrolysing)/GDP/UDP-N,N'-diacetylbacillosamine 2-epimerase (hydrolysing)
MTDRDVAVVTGTRAEYGLVRSSMRAIQNSDVLSLTTVVTGMHLSQQFGSTVDEIRDDGFEITRKVHMLLHGNSETTTAKSLGVGISGIAEAFHDCAPDVVLVAGDRNEVLAAGVTAANMNIPLAHIHGGDKTVGATIDNRIRHALTKFADLHFPASVKSAERIRKLGEEEWRITTVGAPGLDRIVAGEYTRPDVHEQFGFDLDESIVVVLQHPVTTQPDRAGEQIQTTLDALDAVGDELQILHIHPNSDPGSEAMRDVMSDTDIDNLYHTVTNLPRSLFLGTLATADVLVGNSSCGIIEAPSFGLPVVDIGPREESRERAENARHVPHERAAITAAVEDCLFDPAAKAAAADCENPYYYGGAGETVATRLEAVSLNEELLQKQITY